MVLIVLVGAPRHAAWQAAGPALPPGLDAYVTKVVKPTPAERQSLIAGEPFAKLLVADETKEVAVFGAVWISAPIRRYIDAVRNIETLESGGGFQVTKKISTPPVASDFDRLQLPEDDVADLQSCKVGSCEVKLGEQALQRFRSEVDWKRSDTVAQASALMRRLALQYVTGYLEGGNARLAVYRDSSRPTFVAEELRGMIDGMPELAASIPDVRRYLLEYPAATLQGAESFLYWQQAVFGLKPTIRINHLTISQRATDAIVVSKMLYATHYFWTGLELRLLLAAPSRTDGFWFVTLNRSRSDGLSGFTGRVVRGRVQTEVLTGALNGLRATKQRMEQGG